VNDDVSPEIMDAAERLFRWRAEGPALMAAELFRLPAEYDEVTKEGIQEWQWEASRALAKDPHRVSIRSGHGVGKSAFLAWCVFWVQLCFFPTRAPCTAPTAHQIKDVLWAELMKWLNRLKQIEPTLAAQFEWTADEFRVKDASKESFAVARTARAEKPEALQGSHAHGPEAAVLILVDEASGVPDVIFEVGEGVLTAENAFVVMAANPTRTQGYFYDSHHKMRESWHAMQVSCERSPLVSSRYVEEMAKKYGRDSNVFRVRVLGEFPTADLDMLIPLYLCVEAQNRWADLVDDGPIVWGCDPAGMGKDRSALIKRNSARVLEPHKVKRGLEAMQVAGWIYVEWLDTKPEERPVAICIDAIGIGAGIASRLSELGLPIVSVNVSEMPSDRAQYWRLRDELYWKVRDWVALRKSGLHPDDDVCVGELTIFKWLPPTSDGKIRIERKDEVKKRLVIESSPDVAEALMLTFAYNAPVTTGIMAGSAKAPENYTDD